MKAVIFCYAMALAASTALSLGQEMPKATLRPMPDDVAADIVVHPGVVTHAVSPVFVGTNLTQNQPDKKQITLAATLHSVRGLGMKTVRFPNGCLADRYNWQNPPGYSDHR